MTDPIDNDLPVENEDVFAVTQVTRATELESLVGADLVEVAKGRTSSIHRHNLAETVLLFTAGSAEVVIGDTVHEVRAGDRVRINKGVFHGVRTPGEACTFLSVQVPPILDRATGKLDLEPLVAGADR